MLSGPVSFNCLQIKLRQRESFIGDFFSKINGSVWIRTRDLNSNLSKVTEFSELKTSALKKSNNNWRKNVCSLMYKNRDTLEYRFNPFLLGYYLTHKLASVRANHMQMRPMKLQQVSSLMLWCVHIWIEILYRKFWPIWSIKRSTGVSRTSRTKAAHHQTGRICRAHVRITKACLLLRLFCLLVRSKKKIDLTLHFCVCSCRQRRKKDPFTTFYTSNLIDSCVSFQPPNNINLAVDKKEKIHSVWKSLKKSHLVILQLQVHLHRSIIIESFHLH